MAPPDRKSLGRKPLTNPEIAVLSLLVEEDRHGYEIEEIIEERGMREWTEIGFSSIYTVLSRLEKQGLAAARLAAARGKGPARKIHHATPAGRRVYREAVLDALSRPQRLFPLLQQGLAGLPGLPASEAAAALERYAGALRARLAGVRKKRTAGKAPFHVDCMFDYSEHMVSAEAQWVEELARKLRRK
jgi:DNA-binding PadR family transcriptional regulator